MKLPLSKILRKRVHVEIAMLQDEILEIVYSVVDKPVLHGGTAIWRCYGGNRFSEDLDFYFQADENFRARFYQGVGARGLEVTKYKRTMNTIFAKVTNGTVEVRIEVGLRRAKGEVVRQYARTDGSFIDVFTLLPEAIVLEKISAYRSRRLIRDIYDIYHLRNMLEREEMIKKEIASFIADIPKPLDERVLRTVVYSGAAPAFQQIVDALRRRFS